ncbi:MAG: YciI family protein [Pseudomonadota bacterium]
MAFFLVTMTHPDGDGWGRHVIAHVDYLRGLIEAGKIRASGPVSGLGKRAGFIVMTVDDIEEARRLVAEDPFATEGLIDELTILEWDPMFGAFAKESSRAPKVSPGA